MKKIMLFLALSFVFILGGVKQVHALSYDFYEAEYIDGIYMIRDNGFSKYYQKARFFRRSDGRAAYCLEPFATFQADSNSYEETNYSSYLSEEIQKKIVQIAGFGYGYPGHSDPKWYAVTQLMIWREVEPNHEFYFTDTLNGQRTNIYDDEIAEIYHLIEMENQEPSFAWKTFYGVVGQPVILNDENQVLSSYSYEKTIMELDVEKEDNYFQFRAFDEGTYGFTLFKRYHYDQEPIYFYDNPTSQKLMTMGQVDDKLINVFFEFQKLALNIQKIDQDTGTATGNGEASLNGAIFTLYDKNWNKVTDISLDDNASARLTSDMIPSLNYGIYYLKETKTPLGYQANDSIYSFEFTKDNPEISLTIENKIIEKEVIVEKEYGDQYEMKKESGVVFEIYDGKDQLVDVITTDKNGIAKTTLPYGHYTIKQLTTSVGYSMSPPISFFLDNMNNDYYYSIYDYKVVENEKITVEVPNTYLSNLSKGYIYFPWLLFFPLGFYHVQKKYH